jgi:hypothetical protein
VAYDEHLLARASVVQRKTHAPVRFELTEQTREPVGAWIEQSQVSAGDTLFPSPQSPVPSRPLPTCRPASTRGRSNSRPCSWARIRRSMAPTRCAAPRRR